MLLSALPGEFEGASRRAHLVAVLEDGFRGGSLGSAHGIARRARLIQKRAASGLVTAGKCCVGIDMQSGPLLFVCARSPPGGEHCRRCVKAHRGGGE